MKQSADNNKNTAVKKQSGRKYIKPIVITAVILAVVIAAAIIVPKLLRKDTSSTRVVTYNVSEVTYGNISQTVSGSGTVTPVTSETVTSTKGGEVEKVNFTVGEEVKENDVIAVVNGESASVIVKTDGLTPGEDAQISEIVYNETGIVPAQVKIIEKN